jgi:DNA-binding NarL/FixJ family response regulator
MQRLTAPKEAPTDDAARRRILILDDHPVVRYGVRRLLEEQPDLAVCAEAGNGASALAAVKAHHPELVLTDLTLPGGEGLEFIKDMRAYHPQVPVLVVSVHDEELYAERALRAGARGYVMKSEEGGKLLDAIRQVLDGKTYLSEKMSKKLVEVFCGRRRPGDSGPLSGLSDREFEVFRLLGQGLTTGEVGQRLRLSVKTVESHRLHIRQKLGLKSGPALIQYAVRWAGTQELI